MAGPERTKARVETRAFDRSREGCALQFSGQGTGVHLFGAGGGSGIS